jgi:hypothetical protein
MLPILIKNDSLVYIFISLLPILSVISANIALKEEFSNNLMKMNEENDSSIKSVNEILSKIFEGIENDFNKEAFYNKIKRSISMNEKIDYDSLRGLKKKSALFPPWRFPINVLKWSTHPTGKSNAPQEMFDQLSEVLHN